MRQKCGANGGFCCQIAAKLDPLRAFTLAKIAGHSSITMTGRYCHPQAEAIERAFPKLTARELPPVGPSS
jgi:hypothetical protein